MRGNGREMRPHGAVFGHLPGRGRGWVRWVALLLLAAAACDGDEGAGRSTRRETHGNDQDSVEVAGGRAATPRAMPRWNTRVDTVQGGDTFGALLLRNGISVEEAGEIVQFIRHRDLFSLRRLRPGEPVRLRRDRLDRFVALQYERGADEVYVVERLGDSLRGFVDAVDYELRLRKLSGRVETTVAEALPSPQRAIWTAELAAILAFEIDFLTEPRCGDEICLLVEEKWLH
ncbi:MAG: hypothetical protein GF330_02910, partial [Candidatus Eisenbacteria bacterium]|nr:hypothetical protein [Candidatus Eisenbacteria bacterium]